MVPNPHDSLISSLSLPFPQLHYKCPPHMAGPFTSLPHNNSNQKEKRKEKLNTHNTMEASLTTTTLESFTASTKRSVWVSIALAFVVLVSSSSVQSCLGAVYSVGDSSGWTTIGNVDYKAWAANKTFQVGDIIIFKYNPQFHNVMQVTHPEYQTCNASSPISTHTTGNDTITITRHGHHFFLCGVPGHCQAGQKVDINVLRAPSTAAPTPSSAPPPIAAAEVPSPSPRAAAPSSALHDHSRELVTGVAIALAFAFGYA